MIQFDPTVFGTAQTITLSNTLTLSETAGPEVIDGPGANLVTVSGNNAVEVFSVSSDVTAMLEGLTVSNGNVNPAGHGAGIANEGTLVISSATISDNFADAGGGVYNDGTLTVSNSLLANDTAIEGGGIYNSQGSALTVSNSQIVDDLAAAGGGGIWDGDNLGDGIGSTVAISNSTFVGDLAYSNGGAIQNGGGTTPSYPGGPYTPGGDLTISDSTIVGASAVFGGGIANFASGTATISQSTLADNSASEGGGIFNLSGSSLSIFNSTIADNTAGNNGGGICNGLSDYPPIPCTLTAINDTIAYNTVASGDSSNGGGGLYNGVGTATLDNTIVALNSIGTSSAQAADIGVGVGAEVEGAYNLIGIGGSGGLVNGVNGNQVGVASPGLGPLAYYGGPTQTIDLLPSIPAIDKGSNVLAVDPSTG